MRRISSTPSKTIKRGSRRQAPAGTKNYSKDKHDDWYSVIMFFLNFWFKLEGIWFIIRKEMNTKAGIQ